jgi:hypothetical protein
VDPRGLIGEGGTLCVPPVLLGEFVSLGMGFVRPINALQRRSLCAKVSEG